MAKYPPIQIVDDKDEPIGEASMQEAHDEGLLHRIVLVVVKDENGRILLQKRGLTMATNPGRWDVSAAGHVDAGEDYLTAAKRELKEEIGIEGADLRETAYYFSEDKYEERKLNRFRKIYITHVPSDTRFDINKEEVIEVQWFTPEELKRLLVKDPGVLNDDFGEVITHIL
jgi:16S rRNA (adenine1518-N6/adenine1519-N6)-dimethyltransferase